MPNYRIHSFEQIGMVDPFPKEDNLFTPTLPETYVDSVYPAGRMADKDVSPMCIYIPSDLIMFKMIRACIDIEDVSKLWFSNIEVEEYDLDVDDN